MDTNNIDLTVGTIMLGVSALAALGAAVLGASAVVRARDYAGERAWLLLLVGWQLLEPAVTVVLVRLMWPLAPLSLLSLLAPQLFRRWELPWDRERWENLSRWGVARIATCLIVWATLFLASGPTGSAAFRGLGLTTTLGTAVLIGSVRSAARTLRDYPARPRHPAAAGTSA